MKTQTQNRLIRTGGIISGLFLILHIGFYWLFKWESTLEVMNHEDRSILLTLNLVGILFLIYCTGITLFMPKQLVKSVAGKSILLFFASFYLLRIAAEFLYFGFRFPTSIAAIVLCLIPAVCFGLPALKKQ